MNKKIWDIYAPIYEKAMRGDRKAYGLMYERIPKAIQGKDVLEIATGPGLLAKHVAHAAHKMIATDYSDGMIQEAKKGSCPDNLAFEVADAANLPYPDASFDAVIIANALHILPNPQKALREIDRVLKDDGLLIAPNFVNHQKGFVSAIWSKILSIAGVKFEHQWSADEYRDFLESNGWKVMMLEEMSARLTLAYAECVRQANERRQEHGKITLTGVPETMLQTVFARAQETQKVNHKITDEKAVEIISLLDYDFSLAEKDKTMSSGVIARTLVLDRLTNDYLQSYPGAVVINLACGLDTRCYRMSGYSHWYNLDLPEVIEVRKRLLPEDGTVTQIAASAMDAHWASDIAADGKPVLVIMEGLSMYLTEADIRQIFAIIAAHFPNVAVFTETMVPFIVKMVKEKSIEGSHAKFTWGVKNGRALAELLPDFSFAEEHSLVEGMVIIAPVYKVIGKIPAIRNLSNKIIVLERRQGHT